MPRSPVSREQKKPKLRKVPDWCPGGGKDLGFQYDDESRKLALTPERRKKKFVRCGVCGQRFEVYNRECDDAGCVHHHIPKHKAY